MPNWKYNTAFTLVELLVVIGIISLLMSMLLPSLNQARESARTVHCRANLRGLTLAWNMYATDNRDMLCSPDTFLNDPSALWPFYPSTHAEMFPSLIGPSHWVAEGSSSWDLNPVGNTETAIKNGVLWHYTQSIKLYKCVSDRSERLRSYSMSAYMGPNMWLWDGGSGGVTALNQIRKPGEKMVLIDATCYDSAEFGQVTWLSNVFLPFWSYGDNVGWHAYGFSLNSIPTNRHNNGCNITFADLHCEPLKWKDERTIKWINREIDGELASEDGNPDAQNLFKMIGGILP